MTDAVKLNGELARRLPSGLFVLRIVLGLFMLQWTIEKFVLPQTTAHIMEKYFGVELSGFLPQILGGLELIVVITFLLGAYRRLSYGLILLFNLASIGATWHKLIDPYGLLSGTVNHLFTAGVPLLAASWLLYWLRDWDVMWSFDEKRSASAGTAGQRG
ncbi:MAG: hypothetical protein ACE5GZ_05335 [Gammaproteobacteria bacterium]